MRGPRRRRQRSALAGLRARGARALLRPAARRRAPPAPGRTAGPPALDGAVVASVALLTGLGIVMIYSTTAPLSMGRAVPPHFVRHLAGLALALLVLVLALRTPLALWRRLALPLWGASVLLLVATQVAGIDANGARRWLRVPLLGVTFQAAELAKFATPLAVAALLAGARPERWQPLRVAALLTGAPVLLLLLQPDLGSAVVTASLVGGVLFVAGVPLPRLLSCAGVAAAGAGVYMALRPYALARWTGFLAPWQNAQREGFQLVQSFVAFGRGGALGVGLGDGRQKLSYLPEAHTDFILSVVAEELGLVGVLCVLGAFAALVVAGLRVAARAREPFAVLAAFATTAFVAVPAAVNAAVVMGLLPTKGFPLPFLSFGSNSLVFCALAVGILLRIASREAPPGRPALRAARTADWDDWGRA